MKYDYAKNSEYFETEYGNQYLYDRSLETSIITHTGHLFWPLEPRKDEIYIEDIAWGLSVEPRYNGHTIFPYTVGIHSVMLSYIVPKELAPWALLHDASEAYFKDVQSPLKKTMKDYKKYEKNLMNIIAEKFDLNPLIEPPEVKEFDIKLAHSEMMNIGSPVAKIRLKELGYSNDYLFERQNAVKFEEYSYTEVYNKFINRFKELF